MAKANATNGRETLDAARLIVASGQILPQLNHVVWAASDYLATHPDAAEPAYVGVDGKITAYTKITRLPAKDWSRFPGQRRLEELEREAEAAGRATHVAADALLAAQRDEEVVGRGFDGSEAALRASRTADQRVRQAEAALLAAIEAEERARGRVGDVELARGNWGRWQIIREQEALRAAQP